MDFLDPKKKKQHTIRLFVGYVLVGIALLMTTSFLVLESNGYFYDTKTHSVIKNGLIFVDSAPDSATVYVNGKRQDTTDARMVLPEGNYNIEISRDGYKTWEKSLKLEGGSIERLVYPFLFPEKPTLTTSKAYAGEPMFSSQSPDRRWVLVQPIAQSFVFDLYDLAVDPAINTSLTIPATVVSVKPGSTLSLVEWSTDNRHVLLKHSFNSGHEYLMVDREAPAQSFNISARLPGEVIDNIALHDKKFDQFYLYKTAGGILSSYDNRSSLPVEIIRNVAVFKPHGADVIAYISTINPAKPQFIIREDGKNYIVRELPATTSFLVDIARFDNHWYTAVYATGSDMTYIYKDPVASVKKINKPITPLAVRQSIIGFMSFSQNTRFMALQSVDGLVVYDFETLRLMRYQLPFATTSKLVWMDGRRLIGNNKSKLTVFDFDGSNKHEIIELSTQHLPFFDRDYENLLSIGKDPTNPTAFAMRRTPLKLKL